MISPFSVSNNYKIKEYSNPKRELNSLTIKEFLTLHTIQSTGAVASFQMEWLWGKKSKKKLRTLANNGYIGKILLTNGKKNMAVYTIQNPDIDTIMHRLAFAQLYSRFRQIIPVEALLCLKPFTGIIKINKKAFPVIVIRNNDNTKHIHDIIKGVPRIIIIAEEYKEIDTNVPYRITTDRDIIEKPIQDAFYKPDGTIDRNIVKLFPRFEEQFNKKLLTRKI